VSGAAQILRKKNPPAKGRTPLAHLLHALNQPLTGLQCSLEVELAAPRAPDHYVRTIHESLTLIARMRLLVEAVRELTDEPPAADDVTPLALHTLLRAVAEDLHPVAEARQVAIEVRSDDSLVLQGSRRALWQQIFRFLESVLALTESGSVLRVAAEAVQGEGETARMSVTWKPGPAPEFSPFSKSELGLVITQAGWERRGAEWSRTRDGDFEVCLIRIPLGISMSS